jgi:hypothetical protein
MSFVDFHLFGFGEFVDSKAEVRFGLHLTNYLLSKFKNYLNFV